MPDPYIVNGVSYYITDFDQNSGLTAAQVEQIIANAQTQAAFGRMTNDLAGSSNPDDRVVNITIDNPSNGRTNVTWGGGSVVNENLVINIVSSQYGPGAIYKVAGTENGS